VANDWRVTITLSDPSHAGRLAVAMHDHEVEDDARRRLGGRVVVSVEGDRLFLYAGTENAAREAEQVLTQVLAHRGLQAGDTVIERWHPEEEEWQSPSVAMPQTDAEREAEHERLEQEETQQSLKTGHALWEVRIALPSHHEAVELARRLQSESRPVIRRWTLLVLGANDEDDAHAMAQEISKEAPADARVTIAEQGPLLAFVPIGPFGVWS
jgi:hypothetical protein